MGCCKNALQQINNKKKILIEDGIYHCIGYSVINYKIDEKIGSLPKRVTSVIYLLHFTEDYCRQPATVYIKGLELYSITWNLFCKSCGRAS